MITERKKKIDNIVLGFSNRIRESYFKNNYLCVYNEIQLFCENILDLPFVQRIWHWVNDVDVYYLCKCGKKINFSIKNRLKIDK